MRLSELEALARSEIALDADGAIVGGLNEASIAFALRHNCTIKRARQAVAKAARRMRHEVREGRPSGEPMVMTTVYITPDQRDWLRAQPGGMSATMRRLVTQAQDGGQR